jgi:membrane protein insertase Oxa1/YidC/SpoIIIJ
LNHFDLTKLSYEFFGMHLLDSQWIQWILLAVSVALIQFVQIKLSLATKNAESQKGVVLEKKKWEDSYSQLAPDPEMMNKFMLYGMPAMVAVFTYNLFAWIGFYWWISTLFMLFQQLFVNKMRKKAS